MVERTLADGDSEVAAASTVASIAEKRSVPNAPAAAYELRRHIDLDISAFSYIPSRRAAPTPLAPTAPFDLEDCLARLRSKVRVRGWEWDFSSAISELPLAREEAEFWLLVMTATRDHTVTPETVAALLSNRAFSGQCPDLENLDFRKVCPHLVQCLAAVISADELRELLLREPDWVTNRWLHQHVTMRAGFRKYVLPYLDDTAVAEWRSAAITRWNKSSWPANLHASPAPAFYFGAMLGLHAEVHALIEAWPDDLYVDPSWESTLYHRPQEVVFGASSGEQIAQQFRRLQLHTKSGSDVLTFVALTNASALDVVADSIAKAANKDDAAELFAAFSRLHVPEAAPHALALMSNSKAPKFARQWLDDNIDEAIVGLMPVATGTSKLADAALEFLNSLKRRGHADRVAAHLGAVDPEVAARVRAEILDAVETQLPTLARDATPGWWTAALAQAPLKKSKALAWALPADLPVLTVGAHSLGPDHIVELLSALQVSTLEAPHPLLRALREHAASERLGAFGWKLFESWLTAGAPSKEKWAFLAAGFLGNDRTVVKLVPLVRDWPGESQHQRAVLGLEVLRTIGTDTALMQINGIAQKLKFKALKERAVQCMEAIANTRGMTRAQLEDRIVPDCGLDERGERVFDFGPRQFRFVLGPELKPMIRYPDGSTKADLPKPNSKDATLEAAAQVAEWKLLKKQIADVASIQSVRLEQAMVTGRRWTSEEFDRLLVRHPLLVHLVRRLVWGVYEPSGAVLATFRVTEDQTLGDVADEPFDLPPDTRVGVLHPLQLATQPHVLERWGQLFGDYEIVAPFAQLGRPANQLGSEQLAAMSITHFAQRGKLPAQSLVFGLEKLGWARGLPADAGWVGEHSKQFPGANLTAVIEYEAGFSVGYWESAGDQIIARVLFVPGLHAPQMYPDHTNALRLADVDAIALSEVLSDCELLLAKAK